MGPRPRCRCTRRATGSRSPLRRPRRARGRRSRASGSAASFAADGVLDAVEDAPRIAVVALLWSALDVIQLAVQRLLLLGERPWDRDIEIHELIAATRRAEMRHAFPAQPDHLTVLRAARYLHRSRGALDRRDLEIDAERGLRRRDAQNVHEVVALATEERVLAQPDQHVEVARGPTAETGLALTRDAQLLPVVDAGGDVERELVVPALAALAAAAGAEGVDGLARATAARARRHVHEAAEHGLLHLPDLAAPV